MEITKKKFCISKRLLFLLGILFSIVILTTFVSYTKELITLFSKASENNAWRICAINIKTMKNTNNCCNNEELAKGYRCYLNGYSINCNTKNVVKCGHNNCNNTTGLCKDQPSTISPPPVKNPTAILPTMPQYNFKSNICNLYGSYVSPENWQNQCCSTDDINTGRFKCIRTEADSGFIKKAVFYQFHCTAQRYWKCDGNCSKYVGFKKVDYPTCNKIIESSVVQLKIPTLTPTSILIPTPTAKPTQIISSPLKEFQKFMEDNGIADMDNRVFIKQYPHAINEILSVDLQNQLDSMLSMDFTNSQLKDYVFKVTNDEIKYTVNWNISGTTGTTYYAYYFQNCNPTTNPTICFNPNDNKCSKSSGNCDYFGSLSVIVYKDYKHNNNALYEWSISGWNIPPDEDKYPWIFGVDKNDKVYTMASSLVSSVMVEEATKLGNNKVFIGYSTRSGYLLIEIYRENGNIVLRGIYLRD